MAKEYTLKIDPTYEESIGVTIDAVGIGATLFFGLEEMVDAMTQEQRVFLLCALEDCMDLTVVVNLEASKPYRKAYLLSSEARAKEFLEDDGGMDGPEWTTVVL